MVGTAQVNCTEADKKVTCDTMKAIRKGTHDLSMWQHNTTQHTSLGIHSMG